jgi:PAS domain S-box-containing protein
MSEARSSISVRQYVLAVAAIVLAFLLREAMAHQFAVELPPFITFYPAVMVVAMLAGFWPGLLATAVASLLVGYWIFPPRGHFALARTSDTTALAFFFGMGVFMSVVAERYRRDRRRIAAHEKDQAVQEWQRVTLSSIGDAVLATDIAGRISFLNPVAAGLMGWNEQEAQGQPVQRVLQIVKEQTGAPAENIVARVLKEGRTVELANHTALVTRDGRQIPIEDSAAPILDSNGKIAGVVLVFHDVTERRRKEEQLRRLNRTLQALSNSSQALLHATDEAALLEQICKIVTEDCGHAMVWIGYAEDDANKTVRPVAHAGFEEGYLETLRITWADNERGRGPTGTSIRTGQASSCRNMLTDPQFAPWRAEAIKRGYASSLVLPLIGNGKPFGAVTIYSREPDPFAAEEIKLLEELAGNLAYGIGALRAHAARERAEEALRESEQRFRLALRNAPVSVAVQDRELRYIWAYNQRTAPPGGIVGKFDAEIFTPEEARHIVEIKQRVLREGIELCEQMWLNRPSGRIFLDVSFVPIRDDAGQLTGVGCATVDLTSSKLAEERLRLSEEKFAKAFAGNPAAIVLTRLEDGVLLDVNDTWVALIGYSREEAIGRSVREMNIWPTPEAVARFVGELREKGSLRGWEQEFLKKSGEVFVAELSAQILTVSGEKLILSTLLDITARKRAEEALLRSEKLASVGRMAASIAHEINNPLAAVVNSLFLARTSKDASESVRRYLDIADDELRRISHITQQTLGFYRESSAPTSVSVSSVLDAAVDLLRGKIKVRSARIQKQYEGNLQVLAVSGELRQVLSNVLANSLDAIAENGTIKLRISRSTSSITGIPQVRITVADDGKGMDAATRLRIFEPLFTTKESTGSGLGLWVSKQIIDKHQGSIRVRSRSTGNRRGTVVSVILPASRAAENSASAGA